MIDLNRITSNIYFCYLKVEDVTLSYTKMGRDYWKIIAVSIGNQLTRLCLHNWNIENNFIDIQDLQHCHQLKELNIPGLELSEESETKEKEDRNIEAVSFLPNLKKFRSHRCLGIYSYLFEEKKTLTHLELHCSHISTKSSKLNWIEIFNIWQDLEELKIFSSCKLTLAQMTVLVPRLKKLKTLTLPHEICQTDEEFVLAKELIAKWKKTPFNIHFYLDTHDYAPCSLIKKIRNLDLQF